MNATAVPSEEVIAERRRKYSRYFPRQALKASRVPGLLQGEPEFVALERERVAIREAELRMVRERNEWDQRMALAEARNRESTARAMETGDPLPEPLRLDPWPYMDRTKEFWDAKHESLEAVERGLLVDHADRWKARIARPMGKASARAALARRELAEAEDKLRRYSTVIDQIERMDENVSKEWGPAGLGSRSDEMYGAR